MSLDLFVDNYSTSTQLERDRRCEKGKDAMLTYRGRYTAIIDVAKIPRNVKFIKIRADF